MTSPAMGGSGPASDEYFRQLAAFNAQRDSFMQALMQTGRSQYGQPQVQPTVNTVPQAVSQQPDPTQWNDPDLLGAAQFWGIPMEVAQHMPRHVLQSQVAMLRQAAQPDEDTFANRVGAMLAVPEMMAVGGAEAISGLAQSIPILGPVLRRQEGVRKVDTYIRSLEEGIRSSTPENFQPVLSGLNVAGNLAATWFPAEAAWGIASRGAGWATSPILRASLRGAEGVAGELGPATASAARRAFLGSIPQNAVAGAGAAALLQGGQDHPGTAIGVGSILGASMAPLAPVIEALTNKVSKAFLSPEMFEAVKPQVRLEDFQRTPQEQNVATLLKAARGGDPEALAMYKELYRQGAPEANVIPWDVLPRGAGDEWISPTPGVAPELASPGRQIIQAYSRGSNTNLVQTGLDETSAESLATQMNKVETIVKSQELPHIAQETLPDDISVAKAAQSSNPSGTNVIDGITDPAKFVQQLPAAHVSFVQRNGRLAALLSDQPITQGMIQDFEQHGMYAGQQAVLNDGRVVTLDQIDKLGNAWVTGSGGGRIHVPVSTLSPSTSSPGVMAVPQLWDAFNQFADVHTVQTQMAMGGGLSPEQFATVRRASLPQIMDQFLDQIGVTSTASRARITQYFNERYVSDLAATAPEAHAAMQAVKQETAAEALATPLHPVQAVDAMADSKGYVAIPNGKGGWSLRNRAPGVNGAIAPQEISFDSLDSAETWLKKVNRELPDISPATSVPGEGAQGLWREQVQLPNSNEAAPEALHSAIQAMTAENGGVPVVPPEELAAARGDWSKLKNLWNKASAFTPMRPRFASISQKVRDVAGEDFGIAQDYDQLTNNLINHHNQMHEPTNRLADILAPIDTKRLINGEWMRTWQIDDEAQRLGVARQLGWKPDEIDAMERFSQLIQDVSQEDINPELRKYVSTLAQKQSIPELFNSTWDEPAQASAINAWKDHASTTNINLRELDPRVFGESFIRSVFWKRDMAPVFDPIMKKWKGYSDTEGLDRVSGFMKNWMGIMKNGYTADDDLALDMVHTAAQKLMGASFTRQQAKELVNFGMNTVHSSYLGYRVHVMARDALQLFFALPRAGTDLASVIGKYTTDGAYRQMVWDSALNEGAIQLQMPHRVSPGALGGELEQASVGMAPENMSKRMRLVGAVGAEVRDWLPDVLKGSSESVMKPLYLYGKQQELMRALVYRSGFEKAERALGEFRQAGAAGSIDDLMASSGARTYDPAWQEEFKRIVASGDDHKAAGFLGRQLADATQFKYGMSENPTVGRSLTGKLFMQFGSFQTQYVQYLRESLANDFLDRGIGGALVSNGARTLYTFGAVTAALEGASRATGWNFRYMNPFAIGFAGGPAIGMGMGLLQGGAAVGNALFNPDSPGIDRGLAAGGAAASAIGQALNPVAGLYNTAAGVGSALNDSPLPGHALARLALTGQSGALPDIQQVVHSQDLQPAPNAVRQGGWALPSIPNMAPVYPAGVPQPTSDGVQRDQGTSSYPGSDVSNRQNPAVSPTPGTVPPPEVLKEMGVSDPNRVYFKNGQLMYDSQNVGPDGRRSTYNLNQASQILAPGETWEQHEQTLMSAPAGTLDPGRVVRSLDQLDPETANRVQAFKAFAAQNGVSLDLGETARSQSRQSALWAQGRNPAYPGPVVTWTLTSSHQGGRAIDFIANGDSTGRDPAYKWLQEAAKQFGLVPVGPFDPGHVATTDSSLAATPNYPGRGQPPKPFGGSGAMY